MKTYRSNVPRPRYGRLAKPIAVAGCAALIAVGTAGGASAAETDAAEGEGQLVNTGSLSPIAELEGAYSAYGDGEADSTNLDLSALGLVDVTIPTLATVELADLIDLGVVGQFADSGVEGAIGASGAITETGLIDVGAGTDPTQGSVVDLAPLLAGVDADGVMSDLELELGAVAAWAEASRGASVDVDSDYLLSGATFELTSPALSALTADLDDLMADLDTDVNAAVAADGSVTAALEGVGDDLEAVLGTDPLLDELTAVTVNDVTTSVDLDLAGALDTALDEPLVDDNGTVTIDLTTGSISIDLATLYELNNLGANTTLLTDTTINGTIEAAIEDLLVNELPSRLSDAVRTALDDTELTASIGTTLEAAGGPLGTLDVDLSGSLSSILSLDGATDPTLDLSAELLGIDVDVLLAAVEEPVEDLVLPIVGDAVSAVLDTDDIALDVEGLVTGTVTEVDPVLELINEIVTITVNVQEDPGTFENPNGFDPGSFTQRAVGIQLLPVVDGPTVSLASATVRAVDAEDVVITAPSPGTEYSVPEAGDTTDVDVTGTGEPGATIEVTVGDETGSTTVDEDGNWTVTFEDLPVGDHDAVAEQFIDGGSTGTDDTDFSIVVDGDAGPGTGPEDVTIITPTPGTEYTVPDVDDTTDVDVTGTGEPGATVEVTTGGDTDTTTVDEDGDWTVTFEDLPVGDHDATAEQFVDGESTGTDVTDFSIVVEGSGGPGTDPDGSGDLGIIIEYPVIERGGVQVVIGTGFQPGELVTGEQTTGSLDMGTDVADADGTVSFRWQIPAGNQLGENGVVLTGSESGSIDGTFRVIADADNGGSGGSGGSDGSGGSGSGGSTTGGSNSGGGLAQTGFEAGGLVWLTALLLGIGSAAVMIGKRRAQHLAAV